MADWLSAQEKAAQTAKWANTMTKWLLSRTTSRRAWRLVAFTGPGGGESRGIVDLLAIRKDHNTEKAGLERGDLFEMILIQVKGGSAKWPSKTDIERLQKVGRYYRARDIVLAEWRRGRQPTLYRLRKRLPKPFARKAAWITVDCAADVFD